MIAKSIGLFLSPQQLDLRQRHPIFAGQHAHQIRSIQTISATRLICPGFWTLKFGARSFGCLPPKKKQRKRAHYMYIYIYIQIGYKWWLAFWLPIRAAPNQGTRKTELMLTPYESTNQFINRGGFGPPKVV